MFPNKQGEWVISSSLISVISFKLLEDPRSQLGVGPEPVKQGDCLSSSDYIGFCGSDSHLK